VTQTIDLTLNPEIIAVDGVVNGESYAFTLTDSVNGMSVWSATVTRAKDDVYRVSITATNRAGLSTAFSTVIYYGLHLITDRTQFDVDRVNTLAKKGWANMTEEERSEWGVGLKGAYNCTDLNRVQSAVRYLQDRFAGVGYSVDLSSAKTWTLQDVPTRTEMAEYLADVRAIRGVLTLLNTTPTVPDTMVGLTYIKANNIEQILLDVDHLLSNMIASFVYSGEIFGGELQ
jgi:hypothetical protein